MIKAGIIGGAGYTGGELLRLLLRHPQATVTFVQSRSQAGKPVSSVHTDLLGDTDLVFTAEAGKNVDVLFLCLGHGESKTWLDQQTPDPNLRVIDLSHDYRAGGVWGGRSFQYGLPELHRERIRQAGLIANPGCFATALQLALLPLAANGVLGDVYATGITGATGAGQTLSATSHFPWRHANVSAYKTLQHQHHAEVVRSLRSFDGAPELHFVPWRGDFPRGIYLSCTTALAAEIDTLYEWYGAFYAGHPFTVLSRNMIDLKMAVNTNKCLLHLEKSGAHVVVHAALDNLLKGAAGQAVQNMNLMFGLEEEAGLRLKASAF
jgi:N-acetyl-gamma-glutamyl-phosphate reductase